MTRGRSGAARGPELMTPRPLYSTQVISYQTPSDRCRTKSGESSVLVERNPRPAMGVCRAAECVRGADPAANWEYGHLGSIVTLVPRLIGRAGQGRWI